jgi:superfamily II helicase
VSISYEKWKANLIKLGRWPETKEEITMTKTKTLCPACETRTLRSPIAHNSLSRFCDAYICADCGIEEAFCQFFWRAKAEANNKITIKEHHRRSA